MNKYILTEQDKNLINVFSAIPDNYWDFKNEDTRCYTHGIHGYPAIMVAPISRNLIKIAQEHQPVNSLLDPFMGSGSVLIEGQMLNLDYVYGVDLNPLAQLLSKVRTTKLSNDQINEIKSKIVVSISNSIDENQKYIDEFDNFIINEKQLDISAKTGWGYDTNEYINEYKQKYNNSFNFPDFKNIGFWFLPKVLYTLQIIKNSIVKCSDKDIRDFLMITFSETVRKTSNTRNGEFKLFRVKKEQILKNNIDTKKEFFTLLNRNIEKMQDFNSLLVNNKSQVKIINGDTRKIDTIESIPDNSIDLVITSPPYGDSQTTVAYGQYSRLSLQWLDLEILEDIDIKSLDKSLLGGKPDKDKSKWESLGSKTLTDSLEKIALQDSQRADEVFGFYVDLDKCMQGINRKMKDNSYQYWVVGNRTVKGVNLKTDVIIAEMEEKYGVNHIYTFGRNIINKAMPYVNSPTNEAGKTVSTMTKELIVILKKG